MASLSVGAPAPGVHVLAQRSQLLEAEGADALPVEKTDLHLCHVQPAAVLGREVHREPGPQLKGNGFSVVSYQGCNSVSRQVVEHEMDGAGGRVATDDPLQTRVPSDCW